MSAPSPSPIEERWKQLEVLAAEKQATVSCQTGSLTGWWVFIDRAVETDEEHYGVLNRHSFRAETLDTAINQAEDWLRFN